jgi:hypothetical protein
MRIPILGIVVDERFLRHRQRSTSIASMIGAIVAGGLLGYHYLVDGVLSWDLFIVIATTAGVKLALMTWYFLTE